MVNTKKIRGLMAENLMTQKDVAKVIGVSERTFCERMKNGNFTLREATLMIDALHIAEPSDIFFAKVVN